MTENMFDSQGASVSSGMYDIRDIVASDRKMRKDALRLAKIRSYTNQSDVLAEFNDVMAATTNGADIKALEQTEQNNYLALKNKEKYQYMMDNAGNPEAQEEIYNMIALGNVENEVFSDPDDGINATYSDIYANEGIDEFRQRQETGKGYVYDLAEQLFEDNNAVETAGNFVADMLAPDEIKDFFDYAKLIGTDFNGMLEEMSYFQSLDAEEQKIVMEERIPLIAKAADNNPFVVRSMIEMYYSPDIVGEMKFKGTLDASVLLFDIGPIMGSLLKLGKRVRAARSSVKGGVDIGNPEIGATEAVLAGLDKTGEGSKIIDMSPADIAKSGDPYKGAGRGILSGEVPLAGKMQDIQKRPIQSLTEELLPAAGNKVSRGAAKKLRAQKQALEYDIGQVQQQLDNLKNPSLGNKALFTKQAVTLEDRKRRLVTQLEGVSNTISRNNVAAQAAADISRLQQGIIPDRLKPTFDRLVADEAAKIIRPANKVEAEDLKAAVGGAKNNTAASSRDDLIEAASNPAIIDSPELYGLNPKFIDTLRDSIRTPMREAQDLAERESITALSPDQQLVAQNEAVETLRKRSTNAGKVIESVDITDTTKTGFKAKVVLDDGVESTLEYDYKLSESGTFVSDPELAKSNVVPALRKVFSPDVVWADMLGEFVTNITYAGQQAAKLANTLSKKYLEIEKGLTKNDRIEVDTLMQLGDEESTVFTYKELKYGMKEVHLGNQGIKKQYSDEVIGAYYKKRAFYDELHRFRNDMLYNQYKFMGFSNVKYTDKSGKSVQMMGKVYEDARGIGAQLNSGDVFVPNNTISKDNTIVSNEYTIKKLLDAGYKPVKLAEPKILDSAGKRKTEWALVTDSNVTALPKQVLNYSAGYVPRIYKPGYYFVKNMDSAHRETLYAFQNRVEAQKYVDELTSDPNSGYDNLQVREDREFSDLEKLNNGAEMYGGLYTNSRKTKSLMVKTADGEMRPERLSAAHATQRYIQGISNIMPSNTYRMSMVEQWMNTVNQIAKAEGRKGIIKSDGFNGSIDLTPHSTKLMNDAREYLRRSLNIPSDQESFFNNTMRDIGNIMEDKGWKKGGDWVLTNLHGADPIRKMKGLTFNLHLGWFNVRQLWVQAQNASLALSMHPIHGAKAIAEYFPMRAAILSDDPEVWKAVAKQTGMNEAEFVKEIQMVKDSGILDAIVRTADFDANVSGIGSSTFQSYKKAAKAGRIFYEEGEMSGRLITWNIAKRNLRDAGKEITPKSMSEETVRMHMNLQAENAAVWQTNALGIPTQFQQVFAKFAENMLPKQLGGTGKWTAKEKANVVAGQLILYGTIGVPLAEDFLAAAAEMAGTDPITLQRENPTILEGLEEGVWGVMLDSLGIENNFSESGNLLAGLKSNTATQILTAFADHMSGNDVEVDVFDVAIGASGNSLMRGKDAAVGMYEAARNIFTYPSAATVGQELIGVIDGMAAMTSTWSNARKAMYAQHYGMGLRSKRGTINITTEELGANWQTSLARAFGFATDKESALWRAYDYNMESRNEVKATTQALREAYNSFLITGNVELWQYRRAAIMGPYGNTTAGRNINKNFNRSVVDGESMFSRQSSAFVKDYIGNGGVMPLEAGTLLEEGIE